MMKSEKVPFIHSETPKTIDASQEFPLFDDNDVDTESYVDWRERLERWRILPVKI